MEFSNLFQLAIGISLLAFVLVYKAWRRRMLITQLGKQAPQPPGAWPLIGHLHLLGGKIPLCRTLAAMADKHGPVFTIQLGLKKKALVASSWEAAKEIYTTNDHFFLSRPTNSASIYMCYGNALFGFCPYGPYWRHIRKLATLEVLSNRRIELLKNVRASEVDTFIKDLYNLCPKDGSACSVVVDMRKWFSHVSLNMVVRMIAGKRYSSVEDEESERFVRAIKDFMYLSGVLVVSDVIPFTEWLDFKGYVKSMKQNAKDMDYFMTTWLEEHVQNRKDGGKEVQERDFMDAMLTLLADDDYKDNSIFGFKIETVIKATALNLIVGGVDTTILTSTWALALLLNHVEDLKAAQEELDTHVGKERWVKESDLKKLVYLQAIVKETLRLYPAAPLSGPRESIEDCYVSGYHIPRGTKLHVNLWKVHRDPRFWEDPDEFKPERFLTGGPQADIDYRGQHFHYIPFGSGRKACPGFTLGVLMVSLILARVLQGFNLTTPGNEPVDMIDEGLGLNLPKASPLHVVLSPRLPHLLYKP